MVNKKYRQDLLIDLLKINSISGDEKEVAEMVVEDLKNSGFQVKVDRMGNVYGVRGNSASYPLLNAHMDIVELWYNLNSPTYSTTSYFEDEIYESYVDNHKSCTNCYYNEWCDILDTDNFICTGYKLNIESSKDEYDYGDQGYHIEIDGDVITGYGENRVLGGDDKCGIFIALEVARNTKVPMKVLFTVEEEIGLIGMDYFARTNGQWFDDITFSITIDRKYSNQILISQSNIKSCSKDFARMVYLAGKRAKIDCEFDDGSLADVVILRDLVDNAVNISAGYYDPHSIHEYIMYNEVELIVDWVMNLVSNTQKFSRRRYYDVSDLQKELGMQPLTKGGKKKRRA